MIIVASDFKSGREFDSYLGKLLLLKFLYLICSILNSARKWRTQCLDIRISKEKLEAFLDFFYIKKLI